MIYIEEFILIQALHCYNVKYGSGTGVHIRSIRQIQIMQVIHTVPYASIIGEPEQRPISNLWFMPIYTYEPQKQRKVNYHSFHKKNHAFLSVVWLPYSEGFCQQSMGISVTIKRYWCIGNSRPLIDAWFLIRRTTIDTLNWRSRCHYMRMCRHLSFVTIPGDEHPVFSGVDVGYYHPLIIGLNGDVPHSELMTRA